MPTTSVTQRRGSRRRAKVTREVQTEPQADRREFPPGSIEAKLAAIGRSVPKGEWERIPRDYFARLDYYLYGPGAEKRRAKKR